jgi:GntR family transcriptional regulator of vanillate catabolism
MHASTGDGLKWLQITHHQHHAMVEAIERREGARAQAIATEHIEVARLNLRHAYETAQETAHPALRLLKPPASKRVGKVRG